MSNVALRSHISLNAVNLDVFPNAVQEQFD